MFRVEHSQGAAFTMSAEQVWKLLADGRLRWDGTVYRCGDWTVVRVGGGQ
jgi:hypothetical protein